MVLSGANLDDVKELLESNRMRSYTVIQEFGSRVESVEDSRLKEVLKARLGEDSLKTWPLQLMTDPRFNQSHCSCRCYRTIYYY